MESQVELLKSDEVALRVIRKLNLSEDPRFIGGGRESALQSLLRRVAPGYFGETPALSGDERQNSALGRFTKDLSVSRVGVTYAMEIDFDLDKTRDNQPTCDSKPDVWLSDLPLRFSATGI
jgi:succinoglycan biosynthesis transport protein ExoP